MATETRDAMNTSPYPDDVYACNDCGKVLPVDQDGRCMSCAYAALREDFAGALLDAENALVEAIDRAWELKKLAAEVPGLEEIEGTLDAYTVPWLEAFLDDARQPGSLRDVRNAFEGGE